ncbi:MULTISPECIES: hypothetical protein [unclassified Nocardia]|uniref:hypothetical protein n=1 Tax=unclassified Nocardia TaxID=2637762 RepID=UPI003441C2E9
MNRIPPACWSRGRTVRAGQAGDDIGAGMPALYKLAARAGLAPAGPRRRSVRQLEISSGSVDTQVPGPTSVAA